MNIKEICLSDYKLVRPESIKKENGIKKFYDIEVEDDNTFFIVSENDYILSHNCDGNSIAALLLNFFHKYWPDVFDRNMIYKVETPILVAVSRKNKNDKILFYNNDEYKIWSKKSKLKDYEIKYKKGLASLLDDEYKTIINNPKLTLIQKDDISSKSLDIWFGKSSDLRKNELLK